MQELCVAHALNCEKSLLFALFSFRLVRFKINLWSILFLDARFSFQFYNLNFAISALKDFR